MTTRALRRRTDGRLLGGVASGIADFLGVPVLWVRLGFMALVVADGAGVAAYGVFWVLLRQEDGRSVREDRQQRGLLLLGLALTAVTLAVLAPLQLLPGGPTTPALFVAVAGVALVWEQADEARRDRWRTTATEGGARGIVRLAVGAVLVVGGLVGFLATRGQLANARAGLVSTVVVVGGLALLSSPWWIAMTTDLREERRQRIRSEERAEVAAHLHDSVLQTLALIQKASGSPAEVTRLARSQERELRGWLYATRRDGRLGAALERVGVEVEEAHAVTVDVVVVGDCEVDERVGALVAAVREALVNAAKHAGVESVDVYAEVEPERVSVFVRDRGRGFDPAGVPADRHGLAGSVVGRMHRHGGTATVRSTPGSGTEVQLELPRA